MNNIIRTLLQALALATIVSSPAFAQTLLVGTNSQTTTTAVGPNSFGDIEWSSFVAVASGTAVTGHFYTTTTGFSFVMAVYNSGGTTLLGSSSQVTSVSGWNTVTFSPGVSITSGTTYLVSVMTGSDTSAGWQMGTGVAGQFKFFNPTSTFFPTPPSTLPAGSIGTASQISEYLMSSGASGPPPSQFFLSSNLVTTKSLQSSVDVVPRRSE